jgi:predicted nuclease with TOPRIM domain
MSQPPKLPDEAEAEIRRSVTRHYDQVAEIGTLRTEVSHWQTQAQLAQSEVERLTAKLAQAEAKLERLENAVITLRTQFETGGQIWLNGYEALRALKLPAAEPITPRSFLQSIEKKKEPGQ